MIELVLPGLGLAVVGAVGIAVTEVLVRRAEVGAALLLGATLISATLVGRVPSLTLRGDIRVQILDVAFALVLAAAILRVLRLPRFTPWQRWALLVGIMLLLSLVRGAVAFGPQHAVAEFRLFLAFVAGALYFCTFPPSGRVNDRIGRIWLALSIPMMILVCLRWLANFAGINLGVPPEQFGADAAIRVLNGPYTFFLADAVILTVPFWQLHDRRSRRLTWLGALLLLFVVLLNRRTAWLAIVVGLAVIMVRGRRLNRRVVAMVVGAVLLTIAAYVALGGSEGQKQTVATSAVSTGTLDWRIQGWSELLSGRSEDPVQWVIGEPLGSDFTREVQGSEVQAEPHNFYLTLLLRAGVVGLLALVALDWWVVPRVMAAPAAKRPGRPSRARRVPGVAGDADRLVLRVDPRDGAGNHHRPRGGPGRLQPWRCPVSPGAPGGPRLRRRACTGTRCTNRQGAATVGDLNMSVRHAARRAVQRLGLDVQPFPRSAPLFQVVHLMNRRGVTCVIDVGANIGQYASELRRLGFRNSILSLEPLRAEFQVLERRCAKDRSWRCERFAVGGEPGEATINVAGNSVSSSLAPMLSRHHRAAPESRFVRTEEVRVTTIDDLAATHELELATTFLKVDTQGFERHVLAGAASSLELLTGVQLETSLVPLYEDDLQLSSAIELMEAIGLRLAAILPGFTDPVTSETLQCDGVFLRHTE